jgi:cytochrome d ubiquinol oxidase subunit II
MLNTIGPVWDGNEVWVLTAGGATFAAFPEWYATMFSASTSPLLSSSSPSSCAAWAWTTAASATTTPGASAGTWRSSAAPSCGPARGVALTNIVYGTPIKPNPAVAGDYIFDGTLLTLLGPVPLLGGLTFVALFLTHGAFFIALKTDGPIRHEARALGIRAGLVSAVLAVALLLLIGLKHGSLVFWIGTAVAAVALLAGIAMAAKAREGWAFIGTFAAIAFAVVAYFGALFPNAMPSTLGDANSLTLAAASSTPTTLTIMTWAAAIFTPIVLVYTGWTYWVFRKRLAVHHIPEPVAIH